ncbi:MAG: aminotransferase class I and II [Chloroflexota bacterium]
MKVQLPTLRTVTAIRYVAPLREGGSLPAIVEADDLGTYVLKFRGAGQGTLVLVAELLVGELARFLGLPVPEIVFMQLDPLLGRSEPDPEIQALIRASAGLNLALDYLPGSIAFDPLLSPPPNAALASMIVWLDALTTNVDRTVRNTNMLLWHRQLYLIDHGAALFFHHSSANFLERSRSRFTQIRDHVLLGSADDVAGVDTAFAPRLTQDVIEALVQLVPDAWLDTLSVFPDAQEARNAYVAYFLQRLAAPRLFVEEAIHAHSDVV